MSPLPLVDVGLYALWAVGLFGQVNHRQPPSGWR
jgi:hypothetical protein